MGYGDGYPRAAPSGTPVLVNGREVPIAPARGDGYDLRRLRSTGAG
ncbi:hypothetical protein [Klebsiella pneumoniae]